MVETIFSKTKESSQFFNSVGKFSLQNTIPKFSKRTYTKFLKGVLKLTENSQEIICNGVPYQEFTDLQVLALGLGCL